jgi:hypothetical protein
VQTKMQYAEVSEIPFLATKQLYTVYRVYLDRTS